jgi:hypothetical protein
MYNCTDYDTSNPASDNPLDEAAEAKSFITPRALRDGPVSLVVQLSLHYSLSAPFGIAILAGIRAD